MSLVLGAFVGLSLGLTGGGGSIFAVPLLVYVLGVSAREAVGISLASVGATAFVGTLSRLRGGEVDLRTGLFFALWGFLGAPLGSFIASALSDAVLLVAFAILMLGIAGRLWRRASARPDESREVRALVRTPGSRRAPACRRSASGRLSLTSRCAWVLSGVGFSTGVLSGLFGVGGGFVIVPALVFFSALEIRRAVATSLLVIAIVSLSGFTFHALSAGSAIDLPLAATFSLGGVVGLLVGMALARRLPGPALERVFAVSIVLVALFTITRNIVG